MKPVTLVLKTSCLTQRYHLRMSNIKMINYLRVALFTKSSKSNMSFFFPGHLRLPSCYSKGFSSQGQAAFIVPGSHQPVPC